MEEWLEVIQNEGLSKQQQDILAKLGNLPEKSKEKEANSKPAIPNATSTVASTAAAKDDKDDKPQIIEEPMNEDESVSLRRQQEDYNEAEQTMGRVQFAIMQNLVQKMAENNMYDANNINELHRGSVVFREELTGIVNHRTTFQEKLLSSKAPPKARPNSKLDKETELWANQAEYDDEVEHVMSDHDNDKDSDLSFDGCDDRKKVVTSHSDLDKESPKERGSQSFAFDNN